MKLLNLTSSYFLILITPLLLFWSAAFYFSIQFTIYGEIDEYLTFHEHEILQRVKANPDLLNTTSEQNTDFYIQKITQKEYSLLSKRTPEETFQDFQKFIPYEGEEEPFRRKVSVFTFNGNHYQITTFTNFMNSEDMVYTILVNILFFTVLFFILLLILNRFILRNLWKPFYNTLANIKLYRLDKEVQLSYNQSRITEFEELNDSIQELLKNNLTVYRNQKHFIENASHEMQTPVGIIQSKIDLLIEEPGINKEQALLIEDINEQIHRLSRLNQTLLLLSKIENNQFPENEKVNISSVVLKCCEYFKEIMEFKELSLEWEEQEDILVTMNQDLAEILFSNLIKNAINHNIESGYIKIALRKNSVTIINSGPQLSFEPALLFERFQKKTNNAQSNGLGLAIVKKICSLYHFNITYTVLEKQHTISITF